MYSNTYLGYGERGAPVVLENVQTDLALAIDVAVVDTGLEGHLDIEWCSTYDLAAIDQSGCFGYCMLMKYNNFVVLHVVVDDHLDIIPGVKGNALGSLKEIATSYLCILKYTY